MSIEPALDCDALDHLKDAFFRVGWFIPAYIPLGALSQLAAAIISSQSLTDDELETCLAMAYNVNSLAAMVTHRYPLAPVVSQYKETIAEAIEAHFLGLHHVAVAGLAPVIEGVARQQTEAWRIANAKSKVRDVFIALAEKCAENARKYGYGHPVEIQGMMDSFAAWAKNHFYENSNSYPFADGTNRHGILHGAFTDLRYGSRLNFYKVISAVDILTFVDSLTAQISVLSPRESEESKRQADFYCALVKQDLGRPPRRAQNSCAQV